MRKKKVFLTNDQVVDLLKNARKGASNDFLIDKFGICLKTLLRISALIDNSGLSFYKKLQDKTDDDIQKIASKFTTRTKVKKNGTKEELNISFNELNDSIKKLTSVIKELSISLK